MALHQPDPLQPPQRDTPAAPDFLFWIWPRARTGVSGTEAVGRLVGNRSRPLSVISRSALVIRYYQPSVFLHDDRACESSFLCGHAIVLQCIQHGRSVLA